jgi:hypothetical protein
MKTIPPRIIIYAKDIMNITGRQERTARRLISRIRKHFHKEKRDFITIDEFCSFTGVKKEYVREFL